MRIVIAKLTRAAPPAPKGGRGGAGTFSDDDPRAHARARTPVRARARPPTHLKGEKVQGRGACAAHMGALAPLFESYDPANIKYLYLTV